MDFNEFKLDLQAVLEKAKSIANIKRDIKIIEAKLPKIKLQGTLNSTSTRKELNNKLKSVNPKVKINADTTLVEKKMKKLNQQKSNPTITPTVDNSQVVSGLKQAQKETKTLWERFTNGILGINLIRMGIQEVTRAIRQAIVNVKELDAIKTNIQMVSGTSDSGVNAMMSGYNSMAKDLSSTTKDVAEAANEFLRMGESVASTNGLIKSSQVLSKVGMIESAESASYLISSLKGYKIAAENSMDVVSKLTSVDLEAAISAGGLAEALSKCANIADNSGVSINRLIGYTATVGETTQKSMSEVGNSFQALLSRMNNIKIGRFIDDETGESLSDTEAVLNKLGIQLRDTEDSYRSFDNVLDDIGSRWKDFTKVEQNAISVAIAGTRQRENFEALMNNYGNALKYAETAANSAGSALERYGVYQDSIQAKTNELTAAIESLSTNVISEDLYSGIIEATTGVVEFIDKTNLLKGTLAGLATVGISKTIASIGAGFITAAKSTAQLTAAMALFDNGRSVTNLKAIGAACKGLSDQQLKLVLSTKGLTDSQRLQILAGMGVVEAERQQTLTTLGFAAAEDKATLSTFSLKGALNSLWTAISMNPVTAVVTAVSAAITIFSVYKQYVVKASEATQEAIEAFESISSEVESLEDKLSDLNEQINQLDPITDAEDIENLQLETEEIERQLAILKEKQRIAGEEADKAAQKSLGMTEASRYKTEDRESAYGGIETGAAYVTKDEELQNAIEAYENYKAKVDEANDSLANMAETGDYTKKEWDEQEQVVSTYSDKMEDARTHANELATSLDEQKQGLSGNTDASQALLTKIEGVITQYDQWLDEINGTTEALEEQAEAEEEVSNNITQPVSLSISQTIDQLNTQLKPAFDSLKSAYQDIFTDDGFTLENVDTSMLSSIKSAIDELNKMEDVDINVDYSSFENLAKVLTDSSSTADDVKNAFNSLATEIVNSTSATAGMTDETRNMVVQLLESLGVTNAEEVAMYALSEAKAEAFLASYDLANATQDEITAMLAEAESAGIATDMIFKLVAEEQVFNNQGLSVEGKVQELKKLAEAYGQTAVAAKIARMEDEYTKSHQPINYEEIAKAAQAEINNAVNSVHVDFSGIGKGAKSAGSKAGKDYKDGLKEQLSDLDSVISGITSRIDDNIETVRTQKEEAVAAIDAQIEALNEQKSALEDQKKALEEERDARIEIVEQQKKQLELAIKAIDKQIEEKEKVIKGIEAEIKAMKDANEQRKRELDLQKAQYELERLQNQRTILQYSSEKGMHYVQDTKGIRDQKEKVDDAKLEIEIANKQKQIDLIEKEIDLLNEKKDAINEQIDLLDEQIDQINEFYDQQVKAIDKQIEAIDKQIEELQKQKEETEKYYESLIENMEKSKSKYEELTELVGKAELSAKLKQLDIDEEALLNGSEEEFQKLKDAYLDVVFKLNEGNDEVLSALQELSGYNGTAPAMLEDSNTKLDTMNTKLGAANTEVGNVNSSLSETATTTGNVATNVSDVNTNIGKTTGLVNDQKGAFDELKQTIDLIVEAINKKIQAIETGQSTVATATSAEIANFQLLINKILEVKEKLDAVNDTVTTMDRQPIDNLANAFQLLYDKILLVSNLLGVGMEGEGEGAVSGITGAIQALNEISLEEGIIAQFTMLKEAIDSVTAAISGGGGESSEGEGSGSGSGSKGGKSGGKGSEGKGKGEFGGGNSLTGAIKEMGDTAQEVIGEPDAEGDGTVIGEFGSMETAVNDVRDAIGTEGSEGGNGGSGGETDDTLVGSIEHLGDKTEEEMGEPDGDGIIGKFNEFKGVIEEAANHVKSISESLDEIDGKEVECTITVNVKMNGSIPAFASGTVLGNMQIESATYNAQYGKAFASGTIGLKHDEKNALRSEYGQPELTVYPNGTTELTTSPVMSDLPKGTVIYNEEETKKIMDNKSNPVGNAHAEGTIITPLEYIHMLQERTIAKRAQTEPDFSEDDAYKKLMPI